MPGLIEDIQGVKGNPSICIIGAGFAGMCAAIRLRRDLNLENFQMFEMNKGVGGTWLSNCYPGASCDIPIHGYCYGFEKRADWRAQYASQTEILDYMKELAEKYDLNRRTFFHHQIKRLTWHKEINQWTVDIEDLETGRLFERTFDLVINATGSLREPKIPEEFKGFKGQVLHTAMYDPSVSLEGKRVAVVGTGASGIQVVPAVSKMAKKLFVYQRTPSWILPKLDFEFHPILKFIMRLSIFLTLYNLILYALFEGLWFAMVKGSYTNKFFTGVCNWLRNKQLKGRDDLIEKMTPKYTFGCRRTGFAWDYYPAFLQPNTSLVTAKILKVTDDSIITSEGEEKIDVLILATGFKVTDYFAPMEMYDKNGDNVLLKWKKDAPSLFLGIAANDLPNQFILYGPNTSTGHNSVVATIEMQMDWVVKVLKEMLQRNASVWAIKKSAETAYMDDINSQFPKMVWNAANCSPWYANERGDIVAIYPGNLQSYNRRIRKFNMKNVEFDI